MRDLKTLVMGHFKPFVVSVSNHERHRLVTRSSPDKPVPSTIKRLRTGQFANRERGLIRVALISPAKRRSGNDQSQQWQVKHVYLYHRQLGGRFGIRRMRSCACTAVPCSVPHSYSSPVLPPPESLRAEVALEAFGIVSADPELDLLTHIGPIGRPGSTAPTSAMEEWPVSVDLTRLRTFPQNLLLNLPGRAPDLLTRVRSGLRVSDGFMWSGRGAGCSALLSAKGSAFRASISCLNGTYGIETGAAGTILTRYEFAFWPSSTTNDVVYPGGDAGSPAQAMGQEPPSCVPAGDPDELDQEIDVLILYSTPVRQALQGMGINVQQYMQDKLDETQLAMDNSTVPGQAVIAQLHLAHAQEIDRPDNSTVTFGDDLDYLRGDALPIQLRNTWSADLVMLIRETTFDDDYCGLAGTPNRDTPPGPGFAPFAVGVTKRTCDFSGFPFQHEFGHLFGANHDPDNTPPNPLRDWAFAHFANPNGQCGPNPIPIGPDPGARTLVATKHEDCRGECTQILHYSNAQITVTDPWCFTTGIAGARENADVIEECALITAQYRPRNSDIIFADGFE